MDYPSIAIPADAVPRAALPLMQHAVDTYASETNKTASVWREFRDADLSYRPHARSSTLGEVLSHQLLSERRFFGEFLGTSEPAADTIVPKPMAIAAAIDKLVLLARPRLTTLAKADADWWLGRVRFFDVERERIWVFWRRVLHSAHHRTQLTVYLRMLDRRVPAVYGPTADVTWTGADPTNTEAAAGRR